MLSQASASNCLQQSPRLPLGMKATTETYEDPKTVTAFNENGGYRTNEQELIAKYIQKGTVYVLGCGTGRTLTYLPATCDILASDISPQMVAQARANFPHLSIQVADAAALPYADASADIVFFPANGIDYIYPVSRRLTALKEIRRVLKQGGIFAFSSHIPRRPNSWKQWVLRLRSFLSGARKPYVYEYHKWGKLLTHTITPSQQITQLRNVGFDLVEIMGIEGAYPTYVAKKI